MAIESFELKDLQDPKLRDHVEKVRKEGLGVCSKCRWQSGCLACDPEKAWKWAVSKDLGYSGRSAKNEDKKKQDVEKKDGGLGKESRSTGSSNRSSRGSRK